MTQYDDDRDRYAEERGPPTCRTCKEECTWHHTGMRWALMDDDGRLHACDVSDDFDDLTKGLT